MNLSREVLGSKKHLSNYTYFRQKGDTYRQTPRVCRTRLQAALTNIEALDISKRLQARAKAMVELEEEISANNPKVRFVLQKKAELGDVWRLCGSAPELGRWTPEMAPDMSWNTGDKWILEVPLRPGSYTYKAVLRRADGAFSFEEGLNRELKVPYGLKAGEALEVLLEAVPEHVLV